MLAEAATNLQGADYREVTSEQQQMAYEAMEAHARHELGMTPAAAQHYAAQFVDGEEPSDTANTVKRRSEMSTCTTLGRRPSSSRSRITETSRASGPVWRTPVKPVHKPLPLWPLLTVSMTSTPVAPLLVRVTRTFQFSRWLRHQHRLPQKHQPLQTPALRRPRRREAPVQRSRHNPGMLIPTRRPPATVTMNWFCRQPRHEMELALKTMATPIR